MLQHLFYLICAISISLGNCGIADSNILQLSQSSKNSDGVRLFKATIIPCKNHHNGNCETRLDIKAWIDLKDAREIFLIIDEVYDARERANFPLLHPYMIKLSTSQPLLMYPLLLNQVVDVSCNESEVVQRREADNDVPLTNEGGKTKIAFDLFSQYF